MKKEDKTDVIEVKELDNALDNWEEFDRRYIDNEIKIIKAMTDSQLRKEGEERKITNYLSMTREELVDALIEYTKKDVEEAYKEMD